MTKHKPVFFIGIIEILIGTITLLFNLATLIQGTNPKPPNILFFVIIAACVSTYIGFGILFHKKFAYQLLLYFSSVVFLSKLLIFLNVIILNGSLEATVPGPIKNSISIFYHGVLIYILTHKNIRDKFVE